MAMLRRQRIGGLAALTAAATFVFGIVLFATSLSDYTSGDPTPAESAAFVADNEVALHIWYIVIFLVFGVVLVPLVLALHDRLRARAETISQVAAAFGIIWAGLVLAAGMVSNIGVGTVADLFATDTASAESVWSALDAVQNGLGGGNEITGGVWVILIGWAALKTDLLPAPLSYLGIVSGVAGVVTVVPGLEDVGIVFGAGLIVWFTWLGVVLLQELPAGADADADPSETPTA